VGKPERLAEVTPVACSPLLSSQFTPEQKDGQAGDDERARSTKAGATSRGQHQEKRVENGKEKKKDRNEQPRTAGTRTKERGKIVRCTTVPERERETGRGNARVKAHGLFVHDVTYMSVSFLFSSVLLLVDS